MPAASDDATAALAIMREWDWLCCGPDGNEFAPGIDLISIVTRLAIGNIRRPEAIILQLLCRGDLLARGQYKWRKYQDFNHYQHESWLERIKPRHWQWLSASIENGLRDDSGSLGDIKLNLRELGLEDCPAYEWQPSTSSFSYAVLNGVAAWDDDYLEESFSAWDIEAWPKFLDEPSSDEISTGNAPLDTSEAKQRRGRSAAKWWPDFAQELAVYIHDEGIPDGSGHDGQSELLDKICTRLSAAGKPEPGRATVQPVINAVLARIRSAGK